MKVDILGGPNDGSIADIPIGLGEGQKFIVEGVDYFFHNTQSGVSKLVYYKSSLET